jgi:hypothetical protein
MPADTSKSRTLQLKKNSIVVYKRPKLMDDEQFTAFLYAASNDILARFGMSTIVVGVESWDEIMVCDEDMMAKYGWIRKEKVFLHKDQVDLTQYTPEELEEIATMMTDNIEEFRRAQTSEEEE